MVARLQVKRSDQDLPLPHPETSEDWNHTKKGRLMGVPSVGSTSGEERDGENTDPEEANLGVTDDLTQRPDSISGAVEGSRGIGSASLLEVLDRDSSYTRSPYCLRISGRNGTLKS